MDEPVKVTFQIPDAVFWGIAAVAEQQDMKVHEYLVEIAASVNSRRLTVDTDPVAVRWRQGQTDKQIAAALGMTNQAVSMRRRGHGYPANKKLPQLTVAGTNTNTKESK